MKRHAALLVFLFLLFAGAAQAQNWPSFRGPGASGVAEGQNLPAEWDVASGRNVLWKAAIPGLAHSSPIVWGQRVYLTTAVTEEEGVSPELRTGMPGIDAAKDMVRHTWRLYALDLRTGKVVWQTTAHRGVPRIRRHVKASHASATPATDGRRIVALMGSEGLYCFDMDGKLLWKRDVGLLDVGLWGEPEYQWGPSSSPVIYKNLVIVLNDRQQDSFLAAFDLETGKRVWSRARTEKPNWSTPVIFANGGSDELIINAANFFYGYDPASGKELWRFSNSDRQVVVPTPVVAGELVILTGAYPTGANPIFALRPGGKGDISPKKDDREAEYLAWMAPRGSPYTPTPLVYGGILYVLVDNGVFRAYDPATGERIYETRVAPGSFSASPVAADGKIYLSSEDGEVYVVRAGRRYELLATNPIGEVLMATPAISDGVLVVRGRSHVYAIAAAKPAAASADAPTRRE